MSYSIANMSKRPKPRTPEAQALLEAIEAAKVTQIAVADHLGITPSNIGQWVSGYRPVPAEKAPPLAAFLNVDPARISAAYRRLAGAAVQGQGAALPNPAGSGLGDADINRLQAQIDALNLAVGVLAANATRYRPVEAQAAAAVLRKRVPAHQREQGLLRELIAMLESGKAG